MKHPQRFLSKALTSLLAGAVLLLAGTATVEAKKHHNGRHHQKGKGHRRGHGGRVSFGGLSRRGPSFLSSNAVIQSIRDGNIYLREYRTTNLYHMETGGKVYFANGAEGTIADLKAGMLVSPVIGFKRDELARIDILEGGSGRNGGSIHAAKGKGHGRHGKHGKHKGHGKRHRHRK